jgi:hypothetical protein
MKTEEVSGRGNAIVEPGRLWSAAEVAVRSSPAPASPGVYGWYFDQLPGNFDAAGCVEWEGKWLLYVGIAPAKPPSNGRPASRMTLRSRLRTHARRNADASTLRMTLGCLLADRLGIALLRSESGRFRFSADDEAILTQWMAEHASVVWLVHPEPWLVEDNLIATLDLPLNLKGNRTHPFWATLAAVRAAARAAGREPMVRV